ncbi:hypothetical protein [Streptomyces johnsoniae]|uniref:Uncharacterized protein n=1 Tax=Streptomyces johnsoniae TaxID=3075532 RepID=A0ABU2SCT7_9ACTN|nr:hypothetical protein [Streptomyces sp. DSM 41886]MDT0446758.1 hypothetical protein [Streptomyces sp. DSM 41886]
MSLTTTGTPQSAATARRDDVLAIHDRPFIIMDFTPLHAEPPGLPTHSCGAVHHPHQQQPPGRAEIIAQMAVGCALVVVLALAVMLR